MTYSVNWPITVRSAVPFRSGNYYGPIRSPLWEKCARLEQMTLAHTGYAGRVVSATQTAQVHKVYSVATYLDQNPAY